MFKALLFGAECLRGLVLYARDIVAVENLGDVAGGIVLHIKHSAFYDAATLQQSRDT